MNWLPKVNWVSVAVAPVSKSLVVPIWAPSRRIIPLSISLVPKSALTVVDIVKSVTLIPSPIALTLNLANRTLIASLATLPDGESEVLVICKLPWLMVVVLVAAIAPKVSDWLTLR